MEVVGVLTPVVSIHMDDLGLIEFLPNVEELFKIYNEKYFNNYLIDVKLEWEKMTRCAGICMLKPGRSYYKAKSTIAPITALLRYYRYAPPRNDPRVLFVKQGGSIDRDGHGPDFCGFRGQN